jgi:uncharacterized protein
MELGILAAIWRYPVKSLAGESLDASVVGDIGLEGDRERALVVKTPENPRSDKAYRGKEHDRLHLTSEPQAARELAAARGLDVELDSRDERFFDDAPVSIVIDRWLDGLSEHVGYRVEYQRFRPNFFVSAIGSVPDEGQLTGRELQLGDVTLRVRYPIERCVVTTYDLHGGASDPRILRYVAQHRSTWMGIYCDVLHAGIVRTGDRLVLAASGN